MGGDARGLDQLEVETEAPESYVERVHAAEPNGPLYPFSLEDKSRRITEPSPWYTADGARASPWGRTIVPFEMISVLTNKSGRQLPVRGPTLGLFLDLEVRMVAGPVFADYDYELRTKVIGLSESRRTESFWTETAVLDAGTGDVVAMVVLHQGLFKQSYAGYPPDRLR